MGIMRGRWAAVCGLLAAAPGPSCTDLASEYITADLVAAPEHPESVPSGRSVFSTRECNADASHCIFRHVACCDANGHLFAFVADGGAHRPVHHGVACDASGMSPIVGTRYHKSGQDYDLCAAEFTKLNETDKPLYEKIQSPESESASWPPFHTREVPLQM